MLSRLADAPKLKWFCSGMISSHYKRVKETECFKDLPPDALEEIQKLVQNK